MPRTLLPATTLLLLPATALAAPPGISLLSESYQVQGHLWGTMYMPPQPPTYDPRSYDQSFTLPSPTPLSNSLTNPDSPYPNIASASANPFSLAASASVLDGYAVAAAHGIWTFQPLSPTLSLQLDLAAITAGLYFSDSYSASLQDLTANTPLLSLSRTGADFNTFHSTHAWPIPTTYSFIVDPSHTYTLSLDLTTTANNDSHASTFAPTLSAAPEPATLSLVALGLLALPRRTTRNPPLSKE